MDVSGSTNGAESLLWAASQSGAKICFANPGTTEMPLVTALDQVPQIRAVLGLQENVCTGAADGYARMTGSTALTLLHLGPGLANGLANLHNARRAHSPIVNIVGDHTSWHLPYDAPLTSDIAALAGTVGSVFTVESAAGVGAVTAAAIHDANNRPGVATVIVPADYQQDLLDQAPTLEEQPSARPVPANDLIEEIAQRLLVAKRPVLLLGANALTATGQRAAARIMKRVEARAYSETFPARAERGAGLPDIDRLPYFPETAVAALRDAEIVVVVGADSPIAYFGYQGIPSELAPPGAVSMLADPHEDAEQALVLLAEALGADDAAPLGAPMAPSANEDGPLTGASVGRVVAAGLPDGAIVSVEGGTSGYPFFTASATAPVHTVLTNTGGAIGQGLPCALGAALAAPDRRVIALQSDGSGLYTAQALWTMARERCDITVLIAANHTYNVLRTELNRHGNNDYGPQATALTSLSDPSIDWVALASSYGVQAQRVHTTTGLSGALADSLTQPGPTLIEMAL